MEIITSTILAFPLAVFGILLAASIFFAFCEHLKSASATSILFFIIALFVYDVSFTMSVVAVVAYLALGIAWSCVRWNSFHITTIDKLETIRKEHEEGIIKANVAQEESDKIRANMPITENKERIACWILGFIPSFIYHFSHDLVIHLRELVVTRLSGVYGRISRKYTEKANSFQYNDK